MRISIKGMEMPKACVYRENDHLITCPLYDIDGYCGALNTEASHKEDSKLSGCPLVPVPPHGDLIDRDAFLAEQRNLYCENCARRKGMKNGKMKFVYDIGDAPCRACGYGDVLDAIEDAPTIIPAEES